MMSSGTPISGGEGTEGDRFEAMALELAQLRSKVETLEARTWPGTRRRIRAGKASEPSEGSERASVPPSDAGNGHRMSRRRLFGLLGGAAAAGAGLTVAGSITGATSAGADGPNVLLGNGTSGTTNNAVAAATSIVSTSTSATFQVLNNANPQLALAASTTTAGPLTGAHNAGDLFVDNAGVIWYARSTGNPAGWVPLSLPPLFAPITPAPARIYDSRPGQVPLDVQKGALQPEEERVIDLTDNGALDLTGAYAALVNITVVDTAGGGFVALFAADTTWPGNSNINFSGGQILANNATTLFDPTFHMKAHVGGAATDLVVDVMGVYLG